MTPEEMFDDLDDLTKRLALRTTQQKRLRAAGLLRLPLTGSEPLADKVVRMKDVEFVVHAPERHARVLHTNDPETALAVA